MRFYDISVTFFGKTGVDEREEIFTAEYRQEDNKVSSRAPSSISPDALRVWDEVIKYLAPALRNFVEMEIRKLEKIQ